MNQPLINLQIEKPKVKSAGRYCLDSIKLQEIESLTAGSGALADPLVLADIAEVSENSSLHIEEYLEEVDPVAKMLAERTDKLLEKKRGKRKKVKLELEDDIKLEALSGRRGRQTATAVPERAKYCSESEMRENTEPVLMSKFAWVLEEKKLADDQSALNIPTEEIGNTSEDIDIIQSDANLMKPAETKSCRDQLKKIYLAGGSGSQMVDTNDQIESEPDNSETTETNGEEKEKTLTGSSDDRKIIDEAASDKGRKIELSFLIYILGYFSH